MKPYGIARIKELARANADQTGLHMSLKGVFTTTGGRDFYAAPSDWPFMFRHHMLLNIRS
jgi:hypothetical protein